MILEEIQCFLLGARIILAQQERFAQECCQRVRLSLDELNVIAVMDDAAALKRCIALGMGISILSRATVQTDAQQGRLLLFPLGQSAFLRRLYIVYPFIRRMSEQAIHFLDFIKKYYRIG